jgi:hypothetical protein
LIEQTDQQIPVINTLPADPPKSPHRVTLLLRNQDPSGQETGNMLITPGNKINSVPKRLMKLNRFQPNSLSGLVYLNFVLGI